MSTPSTDAICLMRSYGGKVLLPFPMRVQWLIIDWVTCRPLGKLALISSARSCWVQLNSAQRFLIRLFQVERTSFISFMI